MNSYFASVEQQANPFLRGKAVGVCAYLSPNGCIIASSTEAKAKGIKTGFRVKDALKLVPGLVLLENEPAKYRSTTEKIFRILAEYSDALEPYSIDEAFLDLSGWVKNYEQAEKVALEVRARIKDEVGEWLKCSIGISWTKFLAKFAGDIAPKNSLLVIDKNNLDSILAGRNLQDAWGINNAMERRLKAIGINDLGQLKNYDPIKIKRELGSCGYYLWANVNGHEISRVHPEDAPPKSIGHSYCLPRQTTDKKYLLKIIHKLCEKTGRRLRALGLEAQKINFYAGYIYDGGLHKLITPGDKIYITEEIFNPIHDFVMKTEILLPVRMLAVSVFRLSPISGQANLFYDNLKPRSVSRAMDKLNDKYGEYTIVRGTMFDSGDLARDRIGFRKSISVKRGEE
jgi:DNA polymerase-4